MASGFAPSVFLSSNIECELVLKFGSDCNRIDMTWKELLEESEYSIVGASRAVGPDVYRRITSRTW
jgi:hypothetical protein